MRKLPTFWARAFVALGAASVWSCGGSPSEPYPFTELAMSPGMVIEIQNSNGRVRVEALTPLTRRYAWDGSQAERTLIPRTERYRGRLGAYDPASSFTWQFWRTRIVAEDSQIDFASLSELQAHLREGSAVFDWVYNDQGLVVGFAKEPDRRQVNVLVYQFLIQGRKPEAIPGSRPELMEITRAQNAANALEPGAAGASASAA